DEGWDMNGWASGLNRIYGAITVPEEEVAIRCYSEKNYGGYCISLPEGKFTVADLAVYGLRANDMASLEIVDDFYQVKLFTRTDCTGTRLLKRASIKTLSSAYLDKVNSIVVEPNPTGISSIEEDEEQEAIYNLAGQRLSTMQKGINIVNGKKIITK
ncbi:MAG: hypothetical protein J6Y59_08330, partial [Bacteroidaceae bacterium]|nr:hypothetical protein [Bacteroidaceae bacterium]